MMKSRWTKYILIAAVVVIWGFVAKKLLFSKPEPMAISVRINESELEILEDNFLLLNYDDPFLKGYKPAKQTPIHTGKIRREQPNPTSKKKNPVKIVPPIKYTGTIRMGRSTYYLLDVNGLQHTIAVGDEIEGYILTDTFADSVRLMKNGESFTVLTQK